MSWLCRRLQQEADFLRILMTPTFWRGMIENAQRGESIMRRNNQNPNHRDELGLDAEP